MTERGYRGKLQGIYRKFISIYFDQMQYISYAKKTAMQLKHFAAINVK